MDQYDSSMAGESWGAILADYYRAVWKRKWLVLSIFVSVSFLAALYTIRQPKIYEAIATVEIDQQADRILNVSDVHELGSTGYWDSSIYLETQYKIIQSNRVARMVVENLHLDRDLAFLGLANVEDQEKLAEGLEKADPVEIFKKNLQVDPIPDSRLVCIRYRGTDPQLITTIANEVANSFITQNLERKLVSTRNALNWLQEQVRDLREELEKSERALYEFKKANEILSTSMTDKVNLTGSRLEALSSHLSQVEAKYIASKAKMESLETMVSKNSLETVASTELMNDPLIRELKVTISRLENDYTELLKRYKEKHPDVVSVKSKLDEARTGLKREIQNNLSGVRAEHLATQKEVRMINDQLDELKRQAKELTLKESEYNRLMREKDGNQRVYEQVLLRLKEIDLAGMLKANNIRMLDKAKQPALPIKPNVKFNLLIGIFMGILLSISAALGLEMLDNTIKNAEDVKRYLGLPLLGIVPRVKDDPELTKAGVFNIADMFSFYKPKSSVAECCRTIRTNVSFLLPKKDKARLLVTSASPKEGKTTIVSNLAITMANSGKRVLVVDTDMRRPRAHKAFGMDNEYGLSNIIMGTMTQEEAIRRTQVEGLDILTCGPIPPNPAEQIGSERFSQIVDQLGMVYDRIIFDSPPVIAVTDSAILSDIVDGVVLVVKCGQTHRDVAIQAVQNLRDVNANILGTVINDLDLDNKEYGHYYYYYYHRYGYYYGEKENTPEAVNG